MWDVIEFWRYAKNEFMFEKVLAFIGHWEHSTTINEMKI